MSPGVLESFAPDTGLASCFRLRRVEWRETSLSADGTQIIYRFLAPDAESVRLALRHTGIAYDAVQVVAANTAAFSVD